MPAYRHLFTPRAGRPEPRQEALDLVAYLQALGRGARDVWAEWRSVEPAIPAPPPAGDALAARGEGLYRRLCASCHGNAGDGQGEAAGLLALPPRDFVAGHFRFKSTPGGAPPLDADLYRSITLGGGTGSAMPSFYWLPPDDRWALVARIKRFSPARRGGDLSAAERLPEPGGGEGRGATGGAGWGRDGATPADGDRLAEGRRLWDDLGCARCHGAAGQGMSRDEAGGDWADPAGVPVPRSGDLRHACDLRGGASARAIDRAILAGVGWAMPAYADALPDERSLTALRAYVVSLRRPTAP
jgi:mono/diheme cytochrome c family protein